MFIMSSRLHGYISTVPQSQKTHLVITLSEVSSLLTLGAVCTPPTVNYLHYLVTSSTLPAVGPLQLPAPQSGTLSWISSGTRPSAQTVSDVCLRRICLLDTSAFSTSGVLDDNCALFHRLTRTVYLCNGCLALYNVVLTSWVHSSVKYSQQSQLRTPATVE